MNPTVKNSLAVILGFVIGSMINMGLVNIGPLIIPLPEGADVSTMESLRESMELLTPVNFVVPFLAHALGTLTGAFVAAKFAASHHITWSLCIGVLFLIGGAMAAFMLGGPVWFIVSDLVLAYIPMGLLGGVLAGATRHQTA